MSTKILGTTSTIALLCFFGFGDHVALSTPGKDDMENGGRYAGKSQRKPQGSLLNEAVKATGTLARTMKENEIELLKLKVKEESKTEESHRTSHKENESEVDKSRDSKKNNKYLNKYRNSSDDSKETDDITDGAKMNEKTQNSTKRGVKVFVVDVKTEEENQREYSKTDPNTRHKSKTVRKTDNDSLNETSYENSRHTTDLTKKRGETTIESTRKLFIDGGETKVTLTRQPKNQKK